MVQYKCYVDKESSTFFSPKLRDKATNKRVIPKFRKKSLGLSYKLFSLWHSSDKGIFEKDGNHYIVISGTKVKETKSAVFVSINEKDEKFEISET